MALFTLSLAILLPKTIQSQACGSHDDCPKRIPFCSLFLNSTCHSCYQCWYCREGIDGTCGPCGDGYPRKELSCSNSSITSTTTTTPDFQLIECGETVTGTISSDETVHFQFVNEQVQDVTFTDCQSDFDPTLYLYDSNNNEIQQQSTNNCNGDDCYDDAICSTIHRETFTMQDLAVGTYKAELKPYDVGGTYEMEVLCDSMNTTCGSNRDCRIICRWEWSCASMIVNASLASNLYIECEVSNACNDMQIVSGPIEYLYLHCGASEWGQSSCNESVIDVVDTLSVDIECGALGCMNIDVTAQNVINLSVQSDYGGSPWSSYSIFNTNTAVFDCSLGNGSLCFYGVVIDVSSNNNTSSNFKLTCGDEYSCSDSVIDVVDTQSVDIECGWYGCESIDVTARNVMNLSVQSDYYGSESSSYSIFNTNTVVFDCSLDYGSYCFYSSSFYFDDVDDITLNASTEGALNNGVVDVLSNHKRFGNFKLVCGDEESCYNAVVHAKEYLSSVYVVCNGTESCVELDLFCPSGDNCSIYCDSDANEPCQNVTIYLHDDSLPSISCDSDDCGISVGNQGDAHDSYIEMKYEIYNMTYAELNYVAHSLSTFHRKLVHLIEAGIANDEQIEYQHIEVNVTAFNEVMIEDLMEYKNQSNNEAVVMQNKPSLLVTSFTNCSRSYCSYIMTFDDHGFEYFVGRKLRDYFDVEVSYGSAVQFNVAWRAEEVMSFELTEDFIADYLPFFISGSLLTACLLILAAVLCVKEMKKRRQWREALQIRNGLIVSIAIGEYDSRARKREVGGPLDNLPVGSDVENLRNLAEFLNFSFLTVPEKFSWTKDEVMKFIEEDVVDAFFDESGNARFDGLIVSVSSHGMGNNVISSDYKKISRTLIHRSISEKHPEIREIPRIFLFDACDGTRSQQRSKKTEQSVEAAKGGHGGQKSSAIELEWTTENKNPDYNIVVVHGANDGFASLMKNNHIGSYLTYFFARRVRMRIEKHQKKGLGEILTDIQNLLHDSGKQLIRKEFFNNTETLRIERNHSHQHRENAKASDDEEKMVEMMECSKNTADLALEHEAVNSSSHVTSIKAASAALVYMDTEKPSENE